MAYILRDGNNNIILDASTNSSIFFKTNNTNRLRITDTSSIFLNSLDLSGNNLVNINSLTFFGDKIKIGTNAGLTGQGSNSIAIGTSAGLTNQHNNSIIINASGTVLNSGITNSFYVNPIRAKSDPSNNLAYDPTTKEIIYMSPNAIIPSATTIVTTPLQSTFFLNFPTVPDGFWIEVYAWFTLEGNFPGDVGILPNNDGNGANYFHNYMYAQASTDPVYARAAQGGLIGGRMGYSDNSATIPTVSRALIGNYQSTTHTKTMITTYASPYSYTTLAPTLTETCTWKSTTAITSLSMFTNVSGCHFRVGSRFTVNIIR